MQYSVLSVLTVIEVSQKDGTKVAAGNTRSRVALRRHGYQRIIPLWLDLFPNDQILDFNISWEKKGVMFRETK